MCDCLCNYQRFINHLFNLNQPLPPRQPRTQQAAGGAGRAAHMGGLHLKLP